jgi:hypothetical protein
MKSGFYTSVLGDRFGAKEKPAHCCWLSSRVRIRIQVFRDKTTHINSLWTIFITTIHILINFPYFFQPKHFVTSWIAPPAFHLTESKPTSPLALCWAHAPEWPLRAYPLSVASCSVSLIHCLQLFHIPSSITILSLPYVMTTVSLFFFLAVLGFELRAYTSSHSVMGFFEIGSRKLFAWAGFDGEPPDLCLLSS